MQHQCISQHSYVRRTLVAVLLMMCLSLVTVQATHATGPISSYEEIYSYEAATFTQLEAWRHCKTIVTRMGEKGFRAFCRLTAKQWVETKCKATWPKPSCPRIFGIRYHGFTATGWYKCEKFVLWKKYRGPNKWELKGKCADHKKYKKTEEPK